MSEVRSQDSLPQKATPSLVKRSLQGSLGVFLSRVSGIVRSIALNASFGAGVSLDAFFIALRLPSSLRDLLADGALSSAATTVLSESDEQSQAFSLAFAQIMIAFLTVTGIIAGVSSIFAFPVVQSLVETGYPTEGLMQAAVAFRVLAFYLPIALFSALCMAVLSIQGKLLRATVASSFFNFGAIFGALALTPVFMKMGRAAAEGLAWGALLGGLFQCFFLAWPLVQANVINRRDFLSAFSHAPFWKSPQVGRVFALILPRTVGQGALVLGMMVTTFYATSLGPGYLTYLTNTMILILVPVGLFGVAGGYAALPLFSKSRKVGDVQAFWKHLDEGLWLVSFLSAVAVSFMVFFADALLVLMFEYGSFSRKDVILNSSALVAFALSIWFSAQSKIHTQALFALERTTFVAINTFIFIGIQIGGYYFFAETYGILGMGFSSVFASAVSWCASVIVLQRFASNSDGLRVRVCTLRQMILLLASLLSVAGALLIRNYFVPLYFSKPEEFTKLVAFLTLLFGGAVLGTFWIIWLFLAGPSSLRERLHKFLP